MKLISFEMQLLVNALEISSLTKQVLVRATRAAMDVAVKREELTEEEGVHVSFWVSVPNFRAKAKEYDFNPDWVEAEVLSYVERYPAFDGSVECDTGLFYECGDETYKGFNRYMGGSLELGPGRRLVVCPIRDGLCDIWIIDNYQSLALRELRRYYSEQRKWKWVVITGVNRPVFFIEFIQKGGMEE